MKYGPCSSEGPIAIVHLLMGHVKVFDLYAEMSYLIDATAVVNVIKEVL